MAGEPKTLKKIGLNKFLIETTKESHSTSLLKTTKIANINVKITPHNSLNSKKGVIKCPDLKYSPEEEILEELKHADVSSVTKITIRRDGKLISTGTHVLIFETPTLPASIKIATMNIRVEPFIPNPLRCFNCQQFGHHKSNCKRNSICPKCGDKDHPEDNCSSPVKCSNCQGDHPAFSRKCPRWQTEKKIQTLKYTQNISFPEARKIIESQSVTQSRQSYASAVNATSQTNIKVSVSTQTEPVIPTDAEITIKILSKTDQCKNPSSSTSKSSPPTKSSGTSSKNASDVKKTPKGTEAPSQRPSSSHQTSSSRRRSSQSKERKKDHSVLSQGRFAVLDAMETDETSHGSSTNSPET